MIIYAINMPNISTAFDIVGRLSALLIGTIAIDMIINGVTGVIIKFSKYRSTSCYVNIEKMA